MKNLISIIIVNYNGKKWLKKCFNSLFDQSYKNFEIIFVDNASTDDSVKYVNTNYPKIKIVSSKENLGFASGNNLAITHSKGELILLLNNDIWVKKDFLQKYINYFCNHKADVLSVKEAKYDGDPYPDYVSKIDSFGHPIYLFGKKYKNKKSFYLSGSCLLFKRKLYEETMGLDENFFMYSEEVDWFWRLNLFQKKFSYADNICIYHAAAGSTGAGIKYPIFLWRNQNTLQMLLKNYSWYNLIWVLPIYFIQNIIEIIFFLVILKPKIAYSYIEGWIFNVKYFSRIMKKRKWVQEHRLVSDWEIMKKMYFGFGKISHLFGFYLTKNE